MGASVSVEANLLGIGSCKRDWQGQFKAGNVQDVLGNFDALHGNLLDARERVVRDGLL